MDCYSQAVFRAACPRLLFYGSPMISTNSEFVAGLKVSLPFILSVFPFGMVVGTLGVNSGAGFPDVLLQSLLFFAGASQTVMWELYPQGLSLWVIAIAIFAVNFRLVLYSAAIGRRLEPLPKSKMLAALFLLQDISLAVGMQRADSPAGLSWHFYMGLSLVLYVTWITSVALGAGFGVFITDPQMIGLDMLVPVYFLCLVMGFRAKPNAAIIFMTSAGVAAAFFVFVGSPYHIGAGGVAGMLVAAMLANPPQQPVGNENG